MASSDQLLEPLAARRLDRSLAAAAAQTRGPKRRAPTAHRRGAFFEAAVRELLSSSVPSHDVVLLIEEVDTIPNICSVPSPRPRSHFHGVILHDEGTPPETPLPEDLLVENLSPGGRPSRVSFARRAPTPSRQDYYYHSYYYYYHYYYYYY